MQNNVIVISIFMLLCFKNITAQPLPIDEHSIVPLDSVYEAPKSPLDIINTQALDHFFYKLYELEHLKKGKVRIVQVGDSHIQADFLTNSSKNIFQKRFGNGGLGFVFPHKLAKTNGPSTISYKTNAMFLSNRNVRPLANDPIGISGYSLATTNKNSAIEVTIKNQQDYVNSIKIITPNNNKFFDLGFSTTNLIPFQNYTSKNKTHKVVSGETLFSIARKYNVTVDYIKKLNGLNSNTIAAGKLLKIGAHNPVENEINKSNFEIIDLQNEGTSYAYNSKVLLNKFYLVPNHVQNEFYINGLVLENDTPGITYSGIGVNGAKLSDYNKYDLFFEQMQALNPDLLIVSFGTNESFDKLSAKEFIKNLETFITKIRQYTPVVSILVTTPPPSTLYKKYNNTYITDYTKQLIDYAIQYQTIAVFNLYEAFGGTNGVKINKDKGYLAKDEVHYTKNGYEQQGMLLAESILKAYQNYISNK
jgi:lysophospholipase L1-like esterase/LysM repeat protein